MTGSTRGLFACISLCVALTGCAGNGPVDTSVLTSGTTGALSAIPNAASALAKGMKQPTGSPTEIYTRIARGVLTCWLGGYGPLRTQYLFQAEARPEHQGGGSKILIHERIKDAPNQPGRVAFEIQIEPIGETATVSANNKQLPASIGDNLSQDVYRWAADEEGCVEGGVKAGWGATAAARQDKAPKSKNKRK
ncbi:hypothetical protein SAMN04488061_2265 [Filomicrobium insigne]|uniref:Lipoprotein n=1 Tax=Filomicrobium insigne TaxID=418854 RepID=A0A1H0Q5R5_9HYPH|nr:hypothetical protein [Filomicrobium insigne]SDP12742.1 hypothetical protein SAMN04488061_2265 [Filomicrobium insigne]